jgi:tetratricopeptide (TPR) repeat protein
VKVEGKDLKAGSYALFMAMGMDSVTVIFSKETEAWGSFYYREEDDVLRVKVKPVTLDKSVEWLKYEFIDHKEKSCVIAMQWEKLSVPFKVEVDVDNIVVARLRQEVTGPKGFMTHCLIQASSYCFDHDINLEEALTWAKRAITGLYGLTGYIALENLANGYEKLKRIPQADSSMNEALKFANVNQFITYGKTLITQDRKDRALNIMLAAKEKFGDVYVVNDNLSYAYSAKADYAQALVFANKALAQAGSPEAKARVAANIEKLKAGKDINQ